MASINAGASSASRRLKALWLRWALRAVRNGSACRTFDRVYRVGDPWRMSSALEAHRFADTNRIIEAAIGRAETLLEIGCGEGHQTAYLTRVAGRVHGVDVSEIAVSRARKAVPNATFEVADVLRNPRLARGRPYDLVVACEVHYDLNDIPTAVEALNVLGRRCLVTYFYREMPRLDSWLDRVPGAQSSLIDREGTRWKVVWWASPVAGARPSLGPTGGP